MVQERGRGSGIVEAGPGPGCVRAAQSWAVPHALQFLVFTTAGWLNRHQEVLMHYLREEKQVLRAKAPGGTQRGSLPILEMEDVFPPGHLMGEP